MRGSTDIAVKSVLFLLVVIVLIVVISCFLYSLAKGRRNRLNKPEEKNVKLEGALHNSDFRRGRLGIQVQNDASVNPKLMTISDNIINQQSINRSTRFIFTAKKIPSGEEVDWMKWEDSLPPYRFNDLENNSTLYVTEGGLFTEREMYPQTTIYFPSLQKGRWEDDDDMVFVKFAYPDGTLPATDMTGEDTDNTIALYKISENDMILAVPGIPKDSRLSLVVRKKNEGLERLSDSYRVPQKTKDLYIASGKFSLTT